MEKLLHLNAETIHQIWLQAYVEWAQAPEGYRISAEERRQLEHDNIRFAAAVQWQGELEDMMDWSLTLDERTKVTAAFIARNILRNGASAVSVGRALAAIANGHPCVECKRNAASRYWLLPLKRTAVMAFGIEE